MFLHGGEAFPQNNKYFISKFYEVIRKREDANKVIVVVMALSAKESEEGILYKLQEDGYTVMHIILTATDDTLMKRIKSDEKRKDASTAGWVNWQIDFFNREMPDAKRIDTENRSVDSIADEIVSMIEDIT